MMAAEAWKIMEVEMLRWWGEFDIWWSDGDVSGELETFMGIYSMPISRGEGIRVWTWTPRILGFEGKLKCSSSLPSLFRILDEYQFNFKIQYQYLPRDAISLKQKAFLRFFLTFCLQLAKLKKRQDLSQAEDAFTGIIRRSVGLMSRDMGLLQRVARCFHLGFFSWDRRRRHFWKKHNFMNWVQQWECKNVAANVEEMHLEWVLEGKLHQIFRLAAEVVQADSDARMAMVAIAWKKGQTEIAETLLGWGFYFVENPVSLKMHHCHAACFSVQILLSPLFDVLTTGLQNSQRAKCLFLFWHGKVLAWWLWNLEAILHRMTQRRSGKGGGDDLRFVCLRIV